MNPISFTSLIVTYNNANEISNLLTDLYSYVPDNKIIVIDNASIDETADIVQRFHPSVQLIRNSTNKGYAKAVNQGFELCDTEYVLLLNPDIRISSCKVFSAMEACLKHSRQIAAAAPLQFKTDEKMRYLNFTWSYLTPKAFQVYLSFLLQQKRSLCKPVQVTFLNAGCLFIRRSVFYQVGKLNEKYFLYGEEPDLFLKFRRYGFECYLLPNVDVTHYRERSLQSIPHWLRLLIKYRALLNIADALINGWIRILFDNVTVPKSQRLEEN